MNNGPVLIFNDDVSALELTALSLRNSGFSTLTCTSVASALERLQSVGGDVETLITDVTLSDGSGIEIAFNLNARTPGMSVLFVSEHSLEDWTETAVVLFKRLPADSVRFLRKPYSARDLVMKLIELSRDPRPPRHSSQNGRKEHDVRQSDGVTR
jgi:DNA-binding NtrC family response regulator